MTLSELSCYSTIGYSVQRNCNLYKEKIEYIILEAIVIVIKLVDRG